jgi:hypothetical protein
LEEELVRLYEQGWSVRQVAEKFGYSYGVTRRILMRHTVLRSKGGRAESRQATPAPDLEGTPEFAESKLLCRDIGSAGTMLVFHAPLMILWTKPPLSLWMAGTSPGWMVGRARSAPRGVTSG